MINTMTTSIDDVPGWVPIVIVVIIGSILIGLVAFFRGSRR